MILVSVALVEVVTGMAVLAVAWASSSDLAFLGLACFSLLTFGLPDILEGLLDR